MFLFTKPSTMVSAAEALPGRDETMPVPARHEVLDAPIAPPFPDGLEQAVVGMGCFWGAERIFWQAPGVYTTAVGYAGGFTKNPTYEEVCSGRTGHTEAVLVVFDGYGDWRIQGLERVGAKPPGKRSREFFVCAPAA